MVSVCLRRRLRSNKLELLLGSDRLLAVLARKLRYLSLGNCLVDRELAALRSRVACGLFTCDSVFSRPGVSVALIR